MELIQRSESKISVFVRLLQMSLRCERFVDDNCREEDILFFFTECKEKLRNSYPLEEWRTKYGMTLLMVMVDIEDVNPTSKRCMRLLVEQIIKKGIFSDDYINHKAGVDLGLSIQFELQHYLNVAKKGKKKNTVIVAGQKIKLKKVKRKAEDGTYVNITSDKMIDGQVKMISKHSVKLKNPEGSVTAKRIMITCKPTQAPDDLYEDNMDENINWNSTENLLLVETNAEESKGVIPEHFDNDSVHSTGGETFKTRNNHYKYAESTSTRFEQTSANADEITPHYAKSTTLFILACQNNCWGIVKAMLDLNPERYPRLFQDPEPRSQAKHPLFHESDLRGNCLHYAIEDGQLDICKLIIEKVDASTLRTKTIQNNKTAKFIIQEKIDQGNTDFREIKDLIASKIVKK